MQIKGKYSWAKHFDFMIIDLIALLLAFTLAYLIKFRSLEFYNHDEWMRFLLIVALLNIVITFFINPFSGIMHRPYYMEIYHSVQLAAINLIIISIIFYVFKIGSSYSRELVLSMYAMFFCFSTILKYVWKKILVSGKFRLGATKLISMFIVGQKESIESTIQNASAGDFQLYDIKGVHLVDDSTVTDIDSIPVISNDFFKFILDNNIDEVLIAAPFEEKFNQIYKQLIDNGVGLNFTIESVTGIQTEEQFVTNIGVFKALSVGTFSFNPQQTIYLIIKRIADILFGLLGLILLVPISLVIKIVNVLSGDHSPIVYRQKRVGQDGKTIQIFKFRSMVPNADDLLKDLLKDEKYKKEWEENQKFENDPRITKIGKILRKTSIDELPQLINVLIGDMSLVGPRPLVEGELEAHQGLKLYQKVKPGITGWWGCNGRSNIDYRERLELEYYYVKNCSLYLDVLCIFRTALAVLKRDGAK